MWFDQVVTFITSGGLPHSYTAHGPLAVSLMLDFRCIINPFTVHAANEDWTDTHEPSARLQERLERALNVKVDLARRLQGRASSEWSV